MNYIIVDCEPALHMLDWALYACRDIDTPVINFGCAQSLCERALFFVLTGRSLDSVEEICENEMIISILINRAKIVLKDVIRQLECQFISGIFLFDDMGSLVVEID